MPGDLSFETEEQQEIGREKISEEPVTTGVDKEQLAAKIVAEFFESPDEQTEEQPTQAEQLETVYEKLEQLEKQLEGMELRPRVGILADSDEIENQQIDIIKTSDEGRIRVNFKLTKEKYETMKQKCVEEQYQETTLKYGNQSLSYEVGDCWRKDIGDVIINVSMGTNYEKTEQVNCALGLIEISIPEPSEGAGGMAEISKKLDRILKEELNIKTGLAVPDAQAESDYKRARFAWHHRLEETPDNVDDSLGREEVFPGYYTFTEKGKHKEYQQIAPYAIYHELYDDKMLPQIIKAGGLLSTHERYRRGLLGEGRSSSRDMARGGADSVFTSIITPGGKHYTGREHIDSPTGITFIFEPDILDRTDWYAYDQDNYGSTHDRYFKTRLSPTEILEKAEAGNINNELMFRLGIPMDKVKAIACSYSYNGEVLALVETLHKAGITEISGRPVEEVIVQVHDLKDFIGIAQGEPSENVKTAAEILAEEKGRL